MGGAKPREKKNWGQDGVKNKLHENATGESDVGSQGDRKSPIRIVTAESVRFSRGPGLIRVGLNRSLDLNPRLGRVRSKLVQ